MRERAQLDVSGAVGVTVAMESNNVKVNIQGNEQRDAPINRDSTKLNSNAVWIDRRNLVFVPKGTNGSDSDRWYTAGGLLEVGGYLGTQGHTATGRASGRERVCQYVSIWVVAVSFKKKGQEEDREQ